MTDSVASKLSDLSLKQNENRGKAGSSSHSNISPEDKNSANAWKTSQHKSIDKSVLENESWPNLQSQSDHKVESSRRIDDKYNNKKNSKWNHSEVDTSKNNGRGRFSGSMTQSSPNTHANTTPNRPRRGSNFAGRNRIVSDRGKNNGYNRIPGGRGPNRYEEDTSKPSNDSQNNDKNTKDSNNHQAQSNSFEDKMEKKIVDKTSIEEVDYDFKKPKDYKKPQLNYQEDKNLQVNRGFNVISSQNLIPGSFYTPTPSIAPNSIVYPQAISNFPNPAGQIMTDMFYSQLPTGDQNNDGSYQTIKTPVIDIKNMLELCQNAGWDKVYFPKSLRESEPFIDKIPLDKLKDQDGSESSSNEELNKGGAKNVIIIDNKIFLVPKTKYNTTFLKFTTKLDYIRHHLNYYFSEQNLSRDTHLNSIISANRQTCPLNELLQFNRLKWVKTTEAELQEAAQNSPLIQLSVCPDGKIVLIPKSLNKELSGSIYQENNTNYITNPINNLAQTTEEQTYPSGDQYPLPATPVSTSLPNRTGSLVNTTENSGTYDPNQTIQGTNPGTMMLSFLPNNPQAAYINQAQAYIAQQPHGQIHNQANPSIVSPANYFPFPAMPSYFPIFSQNPHPGVAHASNMVPPNQTNILNASPNVQNQSANQTNNQTNQTTPMLVNNGAYISANTVAAQPSVQVLTAFSQQSPYFNNHALNTANHQFRMTQIPTNTFHHQSTCQQPFHQSMLFQIIPPPNNMTNHLLTNVFHHQDNIHALGNRNQFMANPNNGSVINPMVATGNQNLTPSHLSNFTSALSTNNSGSITTDQSRITNSNIQTGSAPYTNSAQKSPASKINNSENFNETSVSQSNESYTNE